MAVKKTTLGKNLSAISALLGSSSDAKPGTTSSAPVQTLALDALNPGQYQPRRHMDDGTLQELAQSIASQGVIQPIVVRKLAKGYEIIAGERRWRASRLAGLTEVPVVIRQMSDQEAMASALIENIQREDLNPIEQARALTRLLEEFSLTHQALAEVVGKSRATISNLLRLLTLPPTIKEALATGVIEMGHARALVSLSPAEQTKLFEQITQQSLTVRETEALARGDKQSSKSEQRDETTQSDKKISKSAEVKEFEKTLSDILQTKVQISPGRNGGKLTIYYDEQDEIEDLIDQLLDE